MQDRSPHIHLVFFFTWDVSLELWQERGMLSREVRYYNELASKGIKITFLTWGGMKDLDFAGSLHSNIKVVPLYTLIPRPSNRVLRALSSLLMLWSARKVLQAATIYKTNQMWGAWCAALAKMIFGRPLIVRTGFELMRFTIMNGHGASRRGFIALLSRLAYGRADMIYLATDEDREFVEARFKVPSSKIAVRPNWIDTGTFKPRKTSTKNRHILFIGRLTDQKNIPLLIDALAIIKKPRIILDVVGQGDREADIRRYAKEKGVSINFRGYVDNTELPQLISSYPLFVLPSKFEGNPKTLLEAMSCGAAVLGTKVEGISSVIKDGKTGMLAKPDAQDMAKKITRLMDNVALRKKLGGAARQQIIKTQDITLLIEKECEDYARLAKR
jgi:glycosyltransferase involved in cell wall biosynthesis